MAIAETIDAFYGDAGATDGVSRSYKQAVSDLDAETIKALDGPYRYVALGDSRSRFTNRIGQPFLIQYRGFAHISLISTNVCIYDSPLVFSGPC